MGEKFEILVGDNKDKPRTDEEEMNERDLNTKNTVNKLISQLYEKSVKGDEILKEIAAELECFSNEDRRLVDRVVFNDEFYWGEFLNAEPEVNKKMLTKLRRFNMEAGNMNAKEVIAKEILKFLKESN